MKYLSYIIFFMTSLFALAETDPFKEGTKQNVQADENNIFNVQLDPSGHKYFPKGRASYYTRYLFAMKEPSIMKPLDKKVKKVFRLTYLRSFDDPIVVRLTLVGEVFKAHVTRLEKDKKHKPVKVDLQKTILMTPEQTKTLLSRLDEKKLWKELTKAEHDMMGRGRDGSMWIFEKHDRKGYSMVDVWCPQYIPELIKEEGIKNDRDFMAYYNLGKTLMKQCGVLPDKDKLY